MASKRDELLARLKSNLTIASRVADMDVFPSNRASSPLPHSHLHTATHTDNSPRHTITHADNPPRHKATYDYHHQARPTSESHTSEPESRSGEFRDNLRNSSSREYLDSGGSSLHDYDGGTQEGRPVHLVKPVIRDPPLEGHGSLAPTVRSILKKSEAHQSQLDDYHRLLPASSEGRYLPMAMAGTVADAERKLTDDRNMVDKILKAISGGGSSELLATLQRQDEERRGELGRRAADAPQSEDLSQKSITNIVDVGRRKDLLRKDDTLRSDDVASREQAARRENAVRPPLSRISVESHASSLISPLPESQALNTRRDPSNVQYSFLHACEPTSISSHQPALTSFASESHDLSCLASQTRKSMFVSKPCNATAPSVSPPSPLGPSSAHPAPTPSLGGADRARLVSAMEEMNANVSVLEEALESLNAMRVSMLDRGAGPQRDALLAENERMQGEIHQRLWTINKAARAVADKLLHDVAGVERGSVGPAAQQQQHMTTSVLLHHSNETLQSSIAAMQHSQHARGDAETDRTGERDRGEVNYSKCQRDEVPLDRLYPAKRLESDDRTSERHYSSKAPRADLALGGDYSRIRQLLEQLVSTENRSRRDRCDDIRPGKDEELVSSSSLKRKRSLSHDVEARTEAAGKDSMSELKRDVNQNQSSDASLARSECKSEQKAEQETRLEVEAGSASRHRGKTSLGKQEGWAVRGDDKLDSGQGLNYLKTTESKNRKQSLHSPNIKRVSEPATKNTKSTSGESSSSRDSSSSSSSSGEESRTSATGHGKLISASQDNKARCDSRDKKSRSASKDKKARSPSKDKKARSPSKDEKARSRSKDRKARSASKDSKKHRSINRDMKRRSPSRDTKAMSVSRAKKQRSASIDKKLGSSSSRDKRQKSTSRDCRRKSSSKDRKHRSSSRNRGRRSSSTNKGRRSSSRNRRRRSSSKSRGRRSSSRKRGRRSSSWDGRRRSRSGDRGRRSSSRSRRRSNSRTRRRSRSSSRLVGAGGRRVGRSRSRDRSRRNKSRSKSRNKSRNRGNSRNKSKDKKQGVEKQKQEQKKIVVLSASEERELKRKEEEERERQRLRDAEEKERSVLEGVESRYMEGERYYDGRAQLCRQCACVLHGLNDLCRHLHSDTHQRRIDADFDKVDLKEEREGEGEESAPPGENLVPARGEEFLLPLAAFFCSICCEFSKDKAHAQVHIRSVAHNNKFKLFLTENPNYEVQFLKERAAVIQAAAAQVEEDAAKEAAREKDMKESCKESNAKVTTIEKATKEDAIEKDAREAIKENDTTKAGKDLFKQEATKSVKVAEEPMKQEPDKKPKTAEVAVNEDVFKPSNDTKTPVDAKTHDSQSFNKFVIKFTSTRQKTLMKKKNVAMSSRFIAGQHSDDDDVIVTGMEPSTVSRTQTGKQTKAQTNTQVLTAQGRVQTTTPSSIQPSSVTELASIPIPATPMPAHLAAKIKFDIKSSNAPNTEPKTEPAEPTTVDLTRGTPAVGWRQSAALMQHNAAMTQKESM